MKKLDPVWRDTMKKSKLGLPLEYQKLSEYFDAQNIGDDTDVIQA
jgi:hypothetical protein